MCIINVNFDLTAIAVVAVLSYFAYRHGYVYVRDKCIAMAHYPKNISKTYSAWNKELTRTILLDINKQTIMIIIMLGIYGT